MFKCNRPKKGDGASKAFEDEALPHIETLFRVAVWLVRDHGRAEELVQETFTEALKSFHRFEADANCCAWLVAIMYRTNYKWRRLWTRLHLMSDAEESISATVAFDAPPPPCATEEQILRAFEKLPRQFQETILLSDIEGMTYKELADVLQVSVGTVMARVSRGRKLLRAQLAADMNARDAIGGMTKADVEAEEASAKVAEQGRE